MNICSFTSLDDIKRKSTDKELIAALKSVKRFSCFEPLWLLQRISDLKKNGKIEYTDMAYPWTGIK